MHECLVSIASKELNQADLLDLFDLTEADLSDETLEDFGDNDYILYRIEKELNTQFNTRKQLLLKVMYTYISHQGGLYDIDAFSMFGTNSFNIVWEKICADVFSNQLDIPIGRLQLPGGLVAPYDAKENETLLSLIEKPLWSESKEPCEAADTLIPDLVTFITENDETSIINSVFSAAGSTVVNSDHPVAMIDHPLVSDLEDSAMIMVGDVDHQISVMEQCIILIFPLVLPSGSEPGPGRGRNQMKLRIFRFFTEDDLTGPDVHAHGAARDEGGKSVRDGGINLFF